MSMLMSMISKAQVSIIFSYLRAILEPRCEKTLTRSATNRAAQPQKIASGLKFRIWKVEGLYYLCGENKGADQLRSCSDDEVTFYIC